jgi:hypothetical protein
MLSIVPPFARDGSHDFILVRASRREISSSVACGAGCRGEKILDRNCVAARRRQEDDDDEEGFNARSAKETVAGGGAVAIRHPQLCQTKAFG